MPVFPNHISSSSLLHLVAGFWTRVCPKRNTKGTLKFLCHRYCHDGSMHAFSELKHKTDSPVSALANSLDISHSYFSIITENLNSFLGGIS